MQAGSYVIGGFRLPPGTTITLSGEDYTVLSVSDSGGGASLTLQSNGLSGAIRILEKDAFLAAVQGGALWASAGSVGGSQNAIGLPFEAFSEKQRAAALRAQRHVMAYIAEPDGPSRINRALAMASIPDGNAALIVNGTDARKPISTKTMRRWLARWRAAGSPSNPDARLFLPRYWNCGCRGEARLDPDSYRLMMEVIHEDNAKGLARRQSVPSLQREIWHRINVHNETHQTALQRPSRATVYRVRKRSDPELYHARLYGAESAARKFGSVHPTRRTDIPLDLVEIDHTTLDLSLIDESFQALGRAHITAAICVATRMIVGIYVSLEKPSAQSVAACLKTCILPKEAFLSHFPVIETEWPCYGTPTEVVVDNGLEFHSSRFLENCASLGITVTHCPVETPKAKPHIERWFGTSAKDLIHKMQGTTFSNPIKRGRYPFTKLAVHTLATLTEEVLRWIVDVYHHTYHSTLGMTPFERWQQQTKKYGRRPLPNPADVDLLLRVPEERTLINVGIKYGGLIYQSADLTRIRSVQGGATVAVFADHSDIRSIKVKDPVTGAIFDVPCTEPERVSLSTPTGGERGMSMAEHVARQSCERASPEEQVGTPEMLRRRAAQGHAKEEFEAQRLAEKKRQKRQKTHAGRPKAQRTLQASAVPAPHSQNPRPTAVSPLATRAQGPLVRQDFDALQYAKQHGYR